MAVTFPKYKEIYELLKNDIYNNVYQKNQLFPTESDLMKKYDVSRTTIRNALKMLQDDGLLASKRGFGTVVTSIKYPDRNIHLSSVTNITNIDFNFNIMEIKEEKSSEAIVDLIPATQVIAEALEIPFGTNVYRIRWLKSVNGISYSFITHHVRMDIAPNLEEKIGSIVSLYNFLYQEYGIKFTEGSETIQVLVASFIEASFLDVAVGKPLLKLCRTAFCNKGPLEYCESIINPDIVSITMTVKSRNPL